MHAALSITHHPANTCFECTVEGQRCVAEYEARGSVMRITHTVVPPSLQGRGIAAALMEAAITHARAHGLRIDPVCSYARSYLARHPQPDVDTL